MRDAQKGFLRPCWASGPVLYCGMCIRGEVRAVRGAACPICSSTVERILEVAEGGSATDMRGRSECSLRVGAPLREEKHAPLLSFSASQKVLA